MYCGICRARLVNLAVFLEAGIEASAAGFAIGEPTDRTQKGECRLQT